ncbi:hypothetical protein OG369_38835 [Streptomyces sp. NBC_01221]|nr:hypothetical protein [Streptomyces sp. NBC_01221]MCX4791819.1 hypothetical protein [Streptomyces sp. NBC_01221]
MAGPARDCAAAGVRDVWFMRPDTRIPHVLFAEGIPARGYGAALAALYAS